MSLLMTLLFMTLLSTCLPTTLAWTTRARAPVPVPVPRQQQSTTTTTTAIAATATLLEQQRTTTTPTKSLWQPHQDTHMFLQQPTTKMAWNQINHAGTVYRWKRAPDEMEPPRGTLGFIIEEEPTPRRSSSLSLTLFSTRSRSNVDSTSWNGARSFDLEEEDNNNNNFVSPERHQRRHRRLSMWSNFSPSYEVVDRLKEERTDLNIEDWQKEMLQETQKNELDEGNVFGWLQQRGDKGTTTTTTTTTTPGEGTKSTKGQSKKTVNSLAEWVRTVDLEPLLQRREEIHREKHYGKQKTPKATTRTTTMPTNMTRQDLVQSLTKLFSDSKDTKYSNYQVQQMYAAAKLADQQGQRAVSRQILQQLLEATPQDARLYRRLARLHKEEGNLAAARAMLQQGLRRDPQNPHLWHGLGQMAATNDEAIAFYRRAIRCDSDFANAYHALGTLQHSLGQIAAARQTLQQGIRHCPANHRLFHALGDLYREAKWLDMAETNYMKALRYGPEVSRGFAYTALAAVAYERDQMDVARQWLVKATKLNHGRHANAWKNLAELEEAEGDTEKARRVCEMALNRYERGLLLYHKKLNQQPNSGQKDKHEDAVAIKNALLQNVPIYRSGDRFFQVYRTWARLEERYGTLESAEKVYERATAAFPHNVAILLDWADLYMRLHLPDRARLIFSMACVRDTTGEAYQRFAAFEMSRGDYHLARRILFRGALRLSQEVDPPQSMAHLYHLWAVCEWNLQDFERTESLLDRAMRLTAPGMEGAAARSTFLYTLARLQFHKGEYLLAQHCLALCWKENHHGDDAPKMWELWAEVAAAMDNPTLQQQCLEQAERSVEDSNSVSKLLSKSPTGLQGMMRHDPWHSKIFPSDTKSPRSPFPYGLQLIPHTDTALELLVVDD